MKSMSLKKNKALLAEWSTPHDLFDKLDAEFGFTLDVCAQPFNAKCKKFFTPDDDGLSQDWGGETAFCCPPSGKKSFREWTAKARKESKKRKTTVVMLLPVSTDSEWFKENIYHQKGVTIRFLPERVKFENPTVPSWVNGNKSGSAGAMRPSMIVIFKGNKKAFKVE